MTDLIYFGVIKDLLLEKFKNVNNVIYYSLISSALNIEWHLFFLIFLMIYFYERYFISINIDSKCTLIYVIFDILI